MALQLGFRNYVYNDALPLYVVVGQGLAINRVNSRIESLADLQAAMRNEGYLAKPGEIDVSPGWEAFNSGWWTYDNETPAPMQPLPDATPSVVVDRASRLPITGRAQNPAPPAVIEIDFTDQQLASDHGAQVTYDVGGGDVVLDIALRPGLTDALIATALVAVLDGQPQLIASGSGAVVEVEPVDGVTLTKLEVALTKT